MNQLKRLFALFLISLFLVGCFEVTTVVKVKQDGSGTIEQRILMGPTMVMMMQMAQQSMQEAQKGLRPEAARPSSPRSQPEGKAPQKFSLFNEDSLRKRAAAMGPGAAFVSAQSIKEGEREGFTVTYKFVDVERLKLNLNPMEDVPTSGEGVKGMSKNQEPIKFALIKGSSKTLLIKMPEQEFKPRSGEKERMQEAKPQADSAQNLAAMQMFLKGFRFSMSVEVEGKIVETNATFSEGTKVTLMEIDFDKLLEDPEKFQKLSLLNPQSLEEAKALLKDVLGIKMETNKITRIVFQ